MEDSFERSANKAPRPALISFVIPHQGRSDLLLATLISVATLEFGDDRGEIMVVTKDVDLDGAALAHETAEKSGRSVSHRPTGDTPVPSVDGEPEDAGSLVLSVLKMSPTVTISALRNRGAMQGHGDYLAFLDADVELSPNWLNAMRDVLAVQPARVIASATQANSPRANSLERVRVAVCNVTVDANMESLSGRNLFLERETFDAVGGFPEHLATCEDYWFTDKANQIGELYYSSAASFVHLGEDKNYPEMVRKEVWRGQSNLASLSGRRISLRESASFLAPLWVLAAMVALIPATIFSGIPAFVILAVAIILPVGLYSWRVLNGSPQKPPVSAVVGFYLLYLPARALGMLIGVVKALANSAKQKSLPYKRVDKRSP
jgi:hypothetical protein